MSPLERGFRGVFTKAKNVDSSQETHIFPNLSPVMEFRQCSSGGMESRDLREMGNGPSCDNPFALRVCQYLKQSHTSAWVPEPVRPPTVHFYKKILSTFPATPYLFETKNSAMKLFHPNICTYEISCPKSDAVSVVGFFFALPFLNFQPSNIRFYDSDCTRT